MYAKRYLCHTWQDGKLVGSRRFDSLVKLKNYLRINEVKFSNDVLSDLADDSVEIKTKDTNLFYEIEALAEEIPDYITEGKKCYISIPLWARQHGVSTKKAHDTLRGKNKIKRGERLYVETGEIV